MGVAAAGCAAAGAGGLTGESGGSTVSYPRQKGKRANRGGRNVSGRLPKLTIPLVKLSGQSE